MHIYMNPLHDQNESNENESNENESNENESNETITSTHVSNDDFLLYFISNIAYDNETSYNNTIDNNTSHNDLIYQNRYLSMFEPTNIYSTINITAVFPMFSNLSDIVQECDLKEIDKITVEEEIDCEICFKTKNYKTALKCGHFYCKDCIVEWIKRLKNTCPMCRNKILHSS